MREPVQESFSRQAREAREGPTSPIPFFYINLASFVLFARDTIFFRFIVFENFKYVWLGFWAQAQLFLRPAQEAQVLNLRQWYLLLLLVRRQRLLDHPSH